MTKEQLQKELDFLYKYPQGQQYKIEEIEKQLKDLNK